MDKLLSRLCSEVSATTVETVEENLKDVDGDIGGIDKVYENLMNEGQKFFEELNRPEINLLGHEVTRDYLPGAKLVKHVLEEVVDRKKRCAELVDVRRLKLQQILQLFTSEQDAEQVIFIILR
jgi:hypothetical protein